MLSTAQALKEWDSVLKLLSDMKAHAATHPGQDLPNRLKQQVGDRFKASEKELASPITTWKQLLKKKVSMSVLLPL